MKNYELKINQTVEDSESIAELAGSGVDDYCKIDCTREYSYLVGIMFFAGNLKKAPFQIKFLKYGRFVTNKCWIKV